MADSAIAASVEELPEGTSLWADAWRRLRKNRAAVGAGLILIVMFLACALVPELSQWDYKQADLELGPTPPSSEHWMGTDFHGRDLMVRVFFGGRISFAVGLIATTVSFVIGVTWGGVAGYFGGRIDRLMMRIVDVLYALPFIFFVILLLTVFERNIVLIFAAIGAIEWLTMARIVRGQTLAIKGKEFIEAARASGVSRKDIILRHILPNVIGPVAVYVTLTIPVVILAESFLSFLGLGVNEPLTSLGVLISDGAHRMEEKPWMLLAPAITMAVTLLCLNFIGDGLRDALDPKDR